MTKNIAHRGFRAKYPENTLTAFARALEAGCDGIELDVQLSADGALVVIHDETVDRTTNGTGAVRGMTLAQLQALDAGGGERIPTLEEYFDLVQDAPLFTNIELKNNVAAYPGLEEKVLESVHRREMAGRVLLSSFNHESVAKCKQLAPDIPCGFIYGGVRDTAALVQKMRKTGVEYLHPGTNSLNEDFFACVAQHGVPYNVWTVNDEATLRLLVARGAAGVFTDDPELFGRI